MHTHLDSETETDEEKDRDGGGYGREAARREEGRRETDSERRGEGAKNRKKRDYYNVIVNGRKLFLHNDSDGFCI